MFEKLVKERYSVRKYSQKPIEEEKLKKILEVGRLSPTAANLQPQVVYVLQSEEAMAKARSVTRMMFNAPMALLVCYDDTKSWKGTAFNDPEYDDGPIDGAIVTSTMMMQATELGLGSLWVRGYCEQDVVEAFNLPPHIHSVCFLVLGYPDETSVPSTKHNSRKPLEETVKYI